MFGKCNLNYDAGGGMTEERLKYIHWIILP
jgi:hypothetical protein